jgi:Exonuclease III
MKIISFNINGLRARPHQLQAIIEQHNPDIIGLQETKFMMKFSLLAS